MLQLAVLWIGWCILHSLLNTATVRRWMEQRGGVWLGGYRLGYVGVAIITLLPLLWYTAGLPQHPLEPPPFWVRGPLLCSALVMFGGGLRVYDVQSFLGLRQWRRYRQDVAGPPPVLHTGGILRLVRHPWYSGGIALLWGLPALTDVTLVTRLILTAYLILGAFLEDRKLGDLLGEPYRQYRCRTPMFIPWRLGHPGRGSGPAIKKKHPG